MVPRRLKRPVHPAISLSDEAPNRIRSLGQRNGFVFVLDLMAELSNSHGQLRVFSQSYATEASGLFNQFSTPRSHRARHHRHAVQYVERPAIQVLTGDVLECLPPREKVYSIPDFRVACHRAHPRIREVSNQFADGVPCRDRGGVQDYDYLCRRMRDSDIEWLRLAWVWRR